MFLYVLQHQSTADEKVLSVAFLCVILQKISIERENTKMPNKLDPPKSQKHKLPLEAKIFIVRLLACCERPRHILAEVKEKFGIELQRSTLKHYDPNYNPKLDSYLKTVFQQTAAQFWSEGQMEPMNSLNYRQGLRRQLYEESGRDRKFKLKILAEATKDAGGFYNDLRRKSVINPASVDRGVVINVKAVTNVTAEDIFKILACFPLDLIPPDIAQYMLEKSYVPASRASELSGASDDDGDD